MQEALNKSIQLLLNASSKDGFYASTNAVNNYKRIWTRDGVVIGLAALCSNNEVLINTFKDHLETIFSFQHATGFLPSNVDVQKQQASYGGSVGRTDNGSWGIIGLCLFDICIKNFSLSQKYKHAIEKIFSVMDAWEFNGKHLIYMPQSGNWADEYFGHGYILSEQLLRIFALRLASVVYDKKAWLQQSQKIEEVVYKNFWNYNNGNKNLYFQTLEKKLNESPKGFWLMGFNPSGYYEQCDLLANALSLILGIGEQGQQAQVIQHFANIFEKQKNIFSCFTPIIQYEDEAMQQLKNVYAYEFRNHPGEFHNGAMWTVWNAFFVWALQINNQTKLATQLSQKVHQSNALNDWDFNECISANTQLPIGVSQCTWSAAASIIAEKSDVLIKLIKD